MTFRPLSSGNSYGNNLGQINDMVRSLNKEQQVKVFKQSAGNAIVLGKYAEGRYGLVISDELGFRRVLIGQAPDDGRPGTWVSKDGEDVVDLLS